MLICMGKNVKKCSLFCKTDALWDINDEVRSSELLMLSMCVGEKMKSLLILESNTGNVTDLSSHKKLVFLLINCADLLPY